MNSKATELLSQFDALTAAIEAIDGQSESLQTEIAELEGLQDPTPDSVLRCLTQKEIKARLPRRHDVLILERNSINEKIRTFLGEVEIPRVQKFLTAKRDACIEQAAKLLKDFGEPNEVKRLCQQLPAVQRWQSRINRCLSPTNSYHSQLRNLIAVESEASEA